MRVQSRGQPPQHLKNDTLPGLGLVQGPVRMCVGCRGLGLRTELVRLVIVTSGQHDTAGENQLRVVVDERRSLPGRGAWLHPEFRCWKAAERKRAVHRALHGERRLDVSSVATWFELFDSQRPKALGE